MRPGRAKVKPPEAAQLAGRDPVDGRLYGAVRPAAGVAVERAAQRHGWHPQDLRGVGNADPANARRLRIAHVFTRAITIIAPR